MERTISNSETCAFLFGCFSGIVRGSATVPRVRKNANNSERLLQLADSSHGNGFCTIEAF